MRRRHTGCAAASADGTALVAGCISGNDQVGLSVHTNFGPAFWSKYIRAFSANAASAHASVHTKPAGHVALNKSDAMFGGVLLRLRRSLARTLSPD